MELSKLIRKSFPHMDMYRGVCLWNAFKNKVVTDPEGKIHDETWIRWAKIISEAVGEETVPRDYYNKECAEDRVQDTLETLIKDGWKLSSK